ncbi:hypothetical protein Tsedi_02016 [Tepidimonas sediminis]|uniref:VCBS repeat-containing protein n=1 Tax=Tepidimonas sediminis TaxID=2588941 RepID=A0A554WL97_9BURK|nr:hypothetical protein [Tepidimonas sediminis]TSE24362.1 hypothetical protein Tsedi_02016 [Tepidimonas sediminis]
MRIEHSHVHLAARHEERVRQHAVTTLRAGAPGRAASQPALRDEATTREPRLAVLVRLVEAMTGLRVRVFRAEALQGDGASASAQPAPAPAASAPGPAWTLEVQRVSVRHELATLRVRAQGQVTLADGRTLAFDFALELRSERLQVEAVAARVQQAAKDPLMIALDGGAIGLSSWRFAFDLDADGQAEAVPFAAPGAGWLVLDRDGNGRIDDGREVLGALSGDGFADLAALDEDGNGWIDEADTAFEALRVWVRAEAADPGRLLTLREAGVGALHTGRVASPWTLRAADGAAAGLLRASGLYLAETGAARALQQIDLVA